MNPNSVTEVRASDCVQTQLLSHVTGLNDSHMICRFVIWVARKCVPIPLCGYTSKIVRCCQTIVTGYQAMVGDGQTMERLVEGSSMSYGCL